MALFPFIRHALYVPDVAPDSQTTRVISKFALPEKFFAGYTSEARDCA